LDKKGKVKLSLTFLELPKINRGRVLRVDEFELHVGEFPGQREARDIIFLGDGLEQLKKPEKIENANWKKKQLLNQENFLERALRRE
jgi:hypothetical protein